MPPSVRTIPRTKENTVSFSVGRMAVRVLLIFVIGSCCEGDSFIFELNADVNFWRGLFLLSSSDESSSFFLFFACSAGNPWYTICVLVRVDVVKGGQNIMRSSTVYGTVRHAHSSVVLRRRHFGECTTITSTKIDVFSLTNSVFCHDEMIAYSSSKA